MRPAYFVHTGLTTASSLLLLLLLDATGASPLAPRPRLASRVLVVVHRSYHTAACRVTLFTFDTGYRLQLIGAVTVLLISSCVFV